MTINKKGKHVKKRAIIYLLLSAIILAIDSVVSKKILNLGVNAIAMSAVQSVLGSLVLFTYILSTGKKSHLKLQKSSWRDVILIGVFVGGIGIVFNSIGLSLTTATNMGFLRLTPFVVAIFSFVLLKERLPKKFWIYLFIVSAGVFLLSTKGGIIAPSVGDLLILSSNLFFAFGVVWSKRTMKKVSPEALTLGRYFIGAIFLLAVILLIDFSQLFSVSNAWQWILLTGFTGATWVALNFKALEIEGATITNTFMRITPALQAFLAYLFLGETLGFIQIAGAVMIFVSMFGVSKVKTKYAN